MESHYSFLTFLRTFTPVGKRGCYWGNPSLPRIEIANVLGLRFAILQDEILTGAVLDRIFIFVVSDPSILPIWPLLIAL